MKGKDSREQCSGSRSLKEVAAILPHNYTIERKRFIARPSDNCLTCLPALVFVKSKFLLFSLLFQVSFSSGPRFESGGHDVVSGAMSGAKKAPLPSQFPATFFAALNHQPAGQR